MVFALYGKKTLLMGFDLRKPKIFGDFGVTNNEGISSYLANRNTLEQVIKPSGSSSTLRWPISISSWPAPSPPNPSELIASERCKQISFKF